MAGMRPRRGAWRALLARRQRDDDRERGSMHVMALPITVGLLSAAILVIAMVGSATDDRREAGTAADAAALAAAQTWDERLGALHGLHLLPGGFADFWGIIEEVLLDAVVADEMRTAAEAYAEANGADLVRFDYDAEHLEVFVEVRHQDQVPVARIRSTAQATAQIRLDGGLCRDGTSLGWMIDGECVTEPDEDEGSDEGPGGPDGDDEQGDEEPGDDAGDDEEPAWEAPEVDAYSSRIVLVD
ncbi:pilus assembly protein TadG-related protein [Promicromonospora sp. NPDC050880]|uniref:pilus assembly protein TadG-related protein n=1 Tax=Promicromonospora sp. NPDC050880 TaxID=3364406 RepID=UPI0037A46B9B